MSRFKGSKTVAWALVLGLGVSASALAQVSVATSDRLQMRAGGRYIAATVEGENILGADLQLQRYGSELRGRAFDAPVSIAFDEGGVTGTIGTAPVRLYVRQAEQGVIAQGLFAGRQSDLRVNPTEIEGRIGSCNYDLTLAGSFYSGFRTCGGSSVPIPTTLQVPEGLVDYPESAKVAVLGLVLGAR